MRLRGGGAGASASALPVGGKEERVACIKAWLVSAVSLPEDDAATYASTLVENGYDTVDAWRDIEPDEWEEMVPTKGHRKRVLRVLIEQFPEGTGGDAEAPVVEVSTPIPDPRWDEAGFESMCERVKLAWLKVGFVRRVAKAGQALRRRQELPPEYLHFGKPPRAVKLYNVSWCWQSFLHPDPEGTKLVELVGILDREKASNDDLVWIDWACNFNRDPALYDATHPMGGEAFQNSRTPEEAQNFSEVIQTLFMLFIYSRIQTVVLPRVSETADVKRAYIERGWTMMELFLAAYCQRILHAKGPGNEDVEEMIRIGLDPVILSDPHPLFLEKVYFTNAADASAVLDRILAPQFAAMPPAPLDALGFRTFCERAQLAWLRVRVVREWANKGGPFPRRQELPAGGFVVGAPPTGRRKFVVSHGWESEMHPSPDGAKMRQLAEALLTLEASDDDLVFFDFCSNSQANKMGNAELPADDPVTKGDGNPPPRPVRNGSSGPYFAANNVLYPLADRTSEQRNAFDYAMWDMGRLYSFKECEVIVLPLLAGQLQPSRDEVRFGFPGGDVWGDVNHRPYKNRGWCCSEFAVALYNRRIANLSDPAVQAVLKSRSWPMGGTTEACRMYAEMMAKTTTEEMSTSKCKTSALAYHPTLGVDFTSKGDRAVVQYNFFKMTMSKESIGL